MYNFNIFFKHVESMSNKINKYNQADMERFRGSNFKILVNSGEGVNGTINKYNQADLEGKEGQISKISSAMVKV